MERFQGQINPCSLDQKVDVRRSIEVQGFAEAQSFALKEEEEEEEEESLDDTVPFLQMLQSEEPNFLTLLSLQTFKVPWDFESYPESYSPVHFEIKDFNQNPISASSIERANQALSSQANMMIPSSSSSPLTANSKRKRKISHLLPPEVTREKRKRRKTKPSKNIEDIESQRMNHIAVERNRRRQMNEHINSLRALLPSSYIQRGDQASIVGGAINYVKNLEQTLQSLESQKRIQLVENTNDHLLWTKHEDGTFIPKIEVTMIQNHINLKVQCTKKQGQLLKGIISLEKLQLTVLHLNIVSLSHSSVSYSFNLKVEDDCDLESVDEITVAARHIFDISDDLINT